MVAQLQLQLLKCSAWVDVSPESTDGSSVTVTVGKVFGIGVDVSPESTDGSSS